MLGLMRFLASQQGDLSVSVYLLVKLSLRAVQSNDTSTPRSDYDHFISGRIGTISDTSVTILSTIDGVTYTYVVYYDAIIYIVSPLLEHLPRWYDGCSPVFTSACHCISPQKLRLLEQFDKALKEHDGAELMSAYVLFDGVRSLDPLPLDAYVVMSPYIIIDETILLPATFLNGYGFVPQCAPTLSLYSKEVNHHV